MSFVSGDILVILSVDNTNNQSVYTTASSSFNADKLYLLAITGEDSSGTPSSVNALGVPTTPGVTWDSVDTQERSGTFAISLFRATASSLINEITTITFPTTQHQCGYILLEVGNIDSSSNGVNAIAQSPVSTGWNATSGSVTLGSAITTGNFAISFIGADSPARNYTAGTNETGLTDATVRSIFSQYNLADDEVLDVGTPDGGAYVEIGVEIAFEAGITTLVCDTGKYLFKGTDATLSAAKDSEPANKWFNADTWKSPTFGTPSNWWEPTTTLTTINCETGKYLFKGTDAAFPITEGLITMTAETGKYLYKGTPFEIQNVLICETGRYLYKGTDASLELNYEIEAVPLHLNVSEFGQKIRINIGKDIRNATELTFTLQPKYGVSVDKTINDLTIGTSNIFVKGKKYLKNQYFVYTTESGDISKIGQWRYRGTATMAGGEYIVTDYEFVDVLE